MSYAKTFVAHVSGTVFKRKFSSSGADSLGGFGSGAGKGGGGGGSIREAGGSLGRYGAAKEEEHFYKKQREQLEDLNKELQKRKRSFKCFKQKEKVDDIIYKNRKRIAELDKCFRKGKDK